MSAQSEVFDPGIDLLGDEDTELVLDAVGALVRNQGGTTLSLREGKFEAGGTSVKVYDVLFDTGALNKSYISAELVERNRDKILSSHIEL